MFETERMLLLQKNFFRVVVFVLLLQIADNIRAVEGRPRRILFDTDVDTDDFFALLYFLKLNRSEFQLEVLY